MFLCISHRLISESFAQALNPGGEPVPSIFYQREYEGEIILSLGILNEFLKGNAKKGERKYTDHDPNDESQHIPEV